MSSMFNRPNAASSGPTGADLATAAVAAVKAAQDAAANPQGGAAATTPQNPLASFADIWQTAATTEGGGQQQTPAAQANNTPAPNAQQPNYFDQQNYTAGLDVNAAVQSLRNGDVEGFTKFISDFAKNLHKQTLKEALQLSQHYAGEAENKAVQRGTANTRSSMAYEALYEKFPIFKDPALNPMARAAFDQSIKKGLKVEDAVEKTGKFFEAMHSSVGTAFQGNVAAPPNAPGSTAFGRRQGAPQGPPRQEIDFDELFAGT